MVTQDMTGRYRVKAGASKALTLPYDLDGLEVGITPEGDERWMEMEWVATQKCTIRRLEAAEWFEPIARPRLIGDTPWNAPCNLDGEHTSIGSVARAIARWAAQREHLLDLLERAETIQPAPESDLRRDIRAALAEHGR